MCTNTHSMQKMTDELLGAQSPGKWYANLLDSRQQPNGTTKKALSFNYHSPQSGIAPSCQFFPLQLLLLQIR